MNLNLTTAELKKLRWLLNVTLEDQEQFLSDETEPDARHEAEHTQRAAEKLLKRLERPRRSIQVVSTIRFQAYDRWARIDLATLLGCAEADLLGFLDTLDVSAQDKEHPAPKRGLALPGRLNQITPPPGGRVDDHGGARHLRPLALPSRQGSVRQPQVQT